MHLGSLESTQEARVALGVTLLSCSPNFPRASITRYTHTKHEPILKWYNLPNYSSTEYRTALRHWNVIDLSLFYNISIFWLYLLNGKRFYFLLAWCATQENKSSKDTCICESFKWPNKQNKLDSGFHWHLLPLNCWLSFQCQKKWNLTISHKCKRFRV